MCLLSGGTVATVVQPLSSTNRLSKQCLSDGVMPSLASNGASSIDVREGKSLCHSESDVHGGLNDRLAAAANTLRGAKDIT